MSDIILEARDLTKSYGPKTALNGLNLTLEKGKIIGLLGPNGSGKSTFIKLCNGILQPTKGEILIGGHEVGVETKKIVSYLPERTYLDDNMSPVQMINFFSDFYEDFDADKAFDMLSSLKVNPKDKMSRQAKLYMLDEPIGGVDPAARDYILRTIISNYNPEASVIISTHLITDIEQVLDEVIFIQNGDLKLHKTVDEIRSIEGKSVDALFREVFRC